MGNSQQTQIDQLIDQFDLAEIICQQTKGIEKKNILIDENSNEDELIYYLVTEKEVEKMIYSQNNNKQIKSPHFTTGENAPPIIHSMIIHSHQRQTSDHQDIKQNGTLIVLILKDSKLILLSGEELQVLKVIQVYAPLDAFRISLIHEIEFMIKEEVLHRQKQQELIEILMEQREDLKSLLKDLKIQTYPMNKKEGEEQDKNQEQSNDDSNKSNSNEEQKQNSEGQEQQSDQTKNNQDNNKEIEDQIEKQQKLMKIQFEVFAQASQATVNELLDIQTICNTSSSVILVGYKCGLIQKVTIEKNLINIQDECIFFNPLNLKLKTEIQKVVDNSEDKIINWQSLNILTLQSLFCVNSTYVIAVHQSQNNNNNSNNNIQNTFIYVYEYQNGKKISYFEGTQYPIVKSFLNPKEVTNKNILYILDSRNVLSLYNYEKGTFLQSFNVDSSLKFIDTNANFFAKEQMFSQISETYKILENIEKVQDKSIDGDIFLYFTQDCRILITQLDYKPITQTIKGDNSNGQKQIVKKILNQKALKVLSSKIPCNYKMSFYHPQNDILFILGDKGQVLRFTNFLASIYYFM